MNLYSKLSKMDGWPEKKEILYGLLNAFNDIKNSENRGYNQAREDFKSFLQKVEVSIEEIKSNTIS